MTEDQLRQAFEKWSDKEFDEVFWEEIGAVHAANMKVFDEFILPLWRALERCVCTFDQDGDLSRKCGNCKAKEEVIGKIES